MSSSDEYNIQTWTRLSTDADREAFPSAIRVGRAAPEFSLPTVDGGRVELAKLRGEGHVALVFGCFTAPPCLVQLPALETLHRTYSGRGVSFAFVYTREIHPGEALPPHHSMEQKMDHARRLRDHGRLTFPVAVDDLSGSVHTAYGAMTSMAVVVHRDGTLIYRGAWTQAPILRMVLENLLLRDQVEAAGSPGRTAYHEWLGFMPREPDDAWETIRLAGPKAWADYRRGLGLPLDS